ncbi:MAG: hypothetical protein Q4D90_02590 [bacterium]|nr:hypothetical protein [bacterium]
MELRNTVGMMNSSDYKERFKAELNQLAIRLEELDKGQLAFLPTCPRSTYDMQFTARDFCLAMLKARAVMEGIDLE